MTRDFEKFTLDGPVARPQSRAEKAVELVFNILAFVCAGIVIGVIIGGALWLFLTVWTSALSMLGN